MNIVFCIVGYICISLSIYSLIFIFGDEMFSDFQINAPEHLIPSVVWPLAIPLSLFVVFFSLLNKTVFQKFQMFLRNARQKRKAAIWKKKNDAEFKKKQRSA